MQATRLLLDEYHSITVEFCKVYYGSNLLKWKSLLDEILGRLSKATEHEEDVLKSVYKGMSTV